MKTIDAALCRSLLPPRSQEGHKGTFGRLLICCGSPAMPGAAALCTGAALRCGVGLVELFSHPAVCRMVGARLPEPVYTPARTARGLSGRLAKASFAVFGPGAGQGASARARLDESSALAARVEEALSQLAGDGASVSDALLALLVSLEADGSGALVDVDTPAMLAALGTAGHLTFLRFNHFFDHISTNRSVLFGGQVSVVSICKRNTQLVCYLVFETVKCAFCFRNNCFVRRSVTWHDSFPPWLCLF